jgi:hypothetical protein
MSINNIDKLPEKYIIREICMYLANEINNILRKAKKEYEIRGVFMYIHVL